jgi:SulP family sulfate permease
VVSGSTKDGGAAPRPHGRWPLFRSFAGYKAGYIGPDLVAGLTLAAIAIPAQMATARLGGLPPQVGFFAFIAATLAFLVFGSSRQVSVGADSTIAPIFAGALAMLAASGSAHYGALAAGMALMVGVIVVAAGLFRMGWIGNLLSVPVTTGFLAGIAAHILVSQAPAALGVTVHATAVVNRVRELVGQGPHANFACVTISGGVLALIAGAHRLSARIPGPLLAVGLATIVAAVLHLPARGVALLGAVPAGLPGFALPSLSVQDVLHLAPLAFLVALLVMVQTAATARSVASPGVEPDINGDFVGLGAGNLLGGLLGAFPVNASPPVTDIVFESGGRSQLAGLTAVAIMVGLLVLGTGLLGLIPQAALAGVLIFVALRIVDTRRIRAVMTSSPGESVLILATAASIVVLPIETGVAIGVGLSLLHGLWSSARTRVRVMRNIPGTTIWWPASAGSPAADTVPGVAVVSFQSALTFLNAEVFARGLLATLRPGIRLVVLEAAGVVDIDFTAAEALKDVLGVCKTTGVAFAVARLESVTAQAAFARLGLGALIGEDHVFSSVWEAVAALAPKDIT